MHRTLLSVAVSLVMTAAAAHVQAQWVKIDDFESGNSFSGGTVIADPTNPANSALSVDSSDITRNLGSGELIADNTVGTVFFQAIVPGGNRDLSFGLAEQDQGTAWGDYLAQILFLDGEIRARDGDGSGGGGSTPIIDPATYDQWYSFWLVLDESAGSYDVYAEGPSISGQQQLASGLGYRRTFDPGDIDKLMFKEGGNGAGDIIFDNFYVDPSGQNLAAIPEPSTLLLAALGVLGIACLSRRRR